MIDVGNPEAMLAEARRRQELRERGARTFDDRPDVAGAYALPLDDERTIDDAELGKLEKEIEHAGDKITLAIGGRVIKFSHPGRTKQTPGIADRLYCFPRLKRAVWWEWKAPEGKQRPDQEIFEEDVTSCGHEYHVGGLGDYKNWLAANGVVAGFNTDGTPIPVLLTMTEAP
jgi:hypothetical protein